MSYVTHTIIDRSGERSFTRHYLPTINDANHDSIAGNGVGQNVGNLRLALADMTNGNFVKHEVTAVSSRAGALVATNPLAQREIKLLVMLREVVTNRPINIEIPCPNLALIGQAGTDEVDQDAQEWIDFVTAMAAFRSDNDQQVTVTGGRIVGRRL